MGDATTWVTVLTPLLGFMGAIGAAWIAYKARHESSVRRRWPEFTNTLQDQLDRQNARIDRQEEAIRGLHQSTSQLRGELHYEQLRSNKLMLYLRSVLAWATQRIDDPPPPPPDELFDDIGDILR